MRRFIITLVCSTILLLGACGQGFDWRDMSIEGTALRIAIPCKSAMEERRVSMGGAEVVLRMFSCTANGVTYAVGHARLADPALVPPVLVQWREATLRSVHATSEAHAAFVPVHASALPESRRVQASGVKSGGGGVHLQGAWFARGTEVFMGLVYAPQLQPVLVDPFFAGLSFS